MNAAQLALIAGAAYFLYRAYAGSSSAPAAGSPAFPLLPAASAAPAPPAPAPASAPAQPASYYTGARGGLLQTGGAGYNSMFGGSGESLTLIPDEWAYWFVRLPGKSQVNAPGSVMESILINLGLTDATRNTLVNVDQFLGAAQSAGLSGLAGPNLPAAAARPWLLALANNGVRRRRRVEASIASSGDWVPRPLYPVDQFTIGDLRAAVRVPLPAFERGADGRVRPVGAPITGVGARGVQ